MNALSKKYEVVVMTSEIYSGMMPYEINQGIKRYHMPNKRSNTIIDCFKFFIRRLNWYFGIFNNKYCIRLMKWAWIQKKYYKEVIDCVNKERPDVVIGLAGGYCGLLERISQECNVKTITWMHNSYEAYFETPRDYCWNRDYVFKDILPKLDGCVVLNKGIAKKYNENFGINCNIIYNPRSFVSQKKADLSQKKFIACGRLVYAKGFDLLIKSFELFCKKNDDWDLVIVGDGPERDNLEKQIQKLGLSERIVVTGFKKQVKEYMLDASIFLLTSRWEGFGLVVIEALELGLPVIAYELEAMEPLITNNVEGILVEKGNTEKFAESMLRLAEDKEKQQQMSENGIKKASQFSIENIMEQWDELFESILKK